MKLMFTCKNDQNFQFYAAINSLLCYQDEHMKNMMGNLVKFAEQNYYLYNKIYLRMNVKVGMICTDLCS